MVITGYHHLTPRDLRLTPFDALRLRYHFSICTFHFEFVKSFRPHALRLTPDGF